jgi:hypothetical protein
MATKLAGFQELKAINPFQRVEMAKTAIIKLIQVGMNISCYF